MRRVITVIISTMLSLIFAVGTATAQSVKISPIPQEISWGEEIAFDNSETYTLVGEADADIDAVRLLKENFTTNGGSVQLIIGERGDASVAAYESLIPQKSEGYYLSVENDKVIIAGNDGSGTYYGVQSYIQIASQPQVMQVTISDYPSVPQRGLVEGYYGNPYSEANRMGLFDFFGRQKMNVYIYGPKDDVYHKDRWREEYPANLAAKITEYVNAAKANKVDFVWAIHPGNDIQWNDTDRRNIVNKLKAMCKLGVRTFAVFWDDLWNDDGTHGDEQAELMNYIAQELTAAYPDVKPLIMCPTQYNRGWANSTYLPALGSLMNSDINIMWTGNSVVDMINYSDMTWINNQIKRKAYIWLNYPVSDYCINHLLMGPTWGNDKNIADMLSGFVSNPMEYAEASKLSLFSIADYTWNMTSYDPDASWEEAIKYIMPENSEAFRFFCQNNVDLGANTHGLRRTDESPEFVTAKELFANMIAAGNRQGAYEAIGAQFNKLIESADIMLGSNEARELIEEITPWIMVMKYLGQRGASIVEMNKALMEGNPENFIDSYLQYQQHTEAQSAIRSRDFSGSLKVASPVVGTVHIEPFIKEKMSELVAEYKENYDYRLDIFPAQVIENGTYHIMHNGKYLTNNKPNVSGSVPQFLSNKDSIRPQRQEWKITLDASTGRYKIVNLEDNRYLNEKGEFSVNNETNPYEAVWHTYNITQLATGKFAIQNAGSAGDKFWVESVTRIKQGTSNEALPDKYVFDLVPLGGDTQKASIENGEVYYIMDGDKYLTNNNVKGSGGTPTFKESETPTAAQEWMITIDPNGKNCYKITSKADGRYLNEYGVFGTNQYYSDWNTYLITKMGDNYSLCWTQSAAKNGAQFIVVSGERLESKAIDWIDSYTVKIINKNDATSIDQTNSNKIKVYYDAASGCIICSGISDGSKVTATHVSGNIAGNTTVYGNCAALHIGSLPTGIYVVTVKNDKEIKAYKIFKQ